MIPVFSRYNHHVQSMLAVEKLRVVVDAARWYDEPEGGQSLGEKLFQQIGQMAPGEDPEVFQKFASETIEARESAERAVANHQRDLILNQEGEAARSQLLEKAQKVGLVQETAMFPETTKKSEEMESFPRRRNGFADGLEMEDQDVSPDVRLYRRNKEILVIQASSAGYLGGCSARITMNEEPISFEQNAHEHHRGLHIAIIDPENGKVISKKVFDTYITSKRFEAFLKLGIPPGSIVVAAGQDECAEQLSTYVKQWFADMGSKDVFQLEYRCAFAFIGINGKRQANEKKATKPEDKVTVTQIFRVDDGSVRTHNVIRYGS